MVETKEITGTEEIVIDNSPEVWEEEATSEVAEIVDESI